MTLRSWDPIIARANFLVGQFTQRFGRPPTLRRLHYELVSDALATSLGYVNAQSDYKRLSELSAVGRRDGSFPDLAEEGRNVVKQPHFENAEQIRRRVREMVRVDRMRDQDYSIAMVVEKVGSRQFLIDWFYDYGVLIHALGGYDSQTQVNLLRNWQARDGRPMLVLYAGDHDASGEDIDRDFQARLLYDDGSEPNITVKRVALLPEQVDQYNLPRSPFEKNDSRAATFQARHGGIWQTELDSMDPDTLRSLYQAELDLWWDYDIYQGRMDEEQALIDEVLGS